MSSAYGKPDTPWERHASLTGRMNPNTSIRQVPGVVLAGFLVVLVAIVVAPGHLLPATSSSGNASLSRLDPALLAALHLAEGDAAEDGVVIHVNSGWRSAKHQDELLREAIAEYGSKAEAARWVATAQTSPHVAGDAIDLGPTRATAWMSQHGAAYGLCQIYRNEPWHYELRPEAVDHGCPPMYADPTYDPRMRR